jgi:hypothetical protein
MLALQSLGFMSESLEDEAAGGNSSRPPKL